MPLPRDIRTALAVLPPEEAKPEEAGPEKAGPAKAAPAKAAPEEASVEEPSVEGPVWPVTWRLLHTAPADGGWNMACDLALMAVAREHNVGVLRVYGWAQPTVSFGRNERLVGRLDADRLASRHLAGVRRPTGGRALLHDAEITYSVVLPVAQRTAWRGVYDHVNRALLAAVQTLGVAASIAPKTSPQTADDSVCFSGISAGEIAVGDRKLVASSVWRQNSAYLQHGSILVNDHQHELAAVLTGDAPSAKPAATLSELLATVPTREKFGAALAQAFTSYGIVDSWSIPESVAQEINALRQSLLLPSWLWRR